MHVDAPEAVAFLQAQGVERASARCDHPKRSASAALKDLTKKDFGPAADATEEEKAKAINEWKGWWKRQAEK